MKRSRDESSTQPEWDPITIVNVVITASVGQTLDLMDAANTLPNTEYFPKKFAALKICRLDPYAKALVFTSGKLVCVGSVSIDHAQDSMNWFIEQLQSTMPDAPFCVTDVQIQNIVGTTKIKNSETQINLLRVYKSAPQHVQYEVSQSRVPLRYAYTNRST